MRRHYYPDIWASMHIIVLYTFTQVVVEFPLALYDYNNGTALMSESIIRLPLFTITTLFILFYGYKRGGFKLKEVFPLSKFPLLSLIPLTVILIALQFYLQDITILMVEAIPPPEWFMKLFEPLFDNSPGEWSGAVRVMLVAPIVEEFIFRGVIMKGLIKNYKPGTAIFWSATLFALFHLNPWQMPAAFLLGIISGVVRVRTGSLLYSVLVHAVHNGFVYASIRYYQELKPIVDIPRDLNSYIVVSIATIIAFTLLFITTKKRELSK